MAPDRYTELFFLDEATALAAGRRPCFECRRERFLAFQSAMAAGLGLPAFAAREIDNRLYKVGLTPDGTKRAFVADLEPPSDGVFVVHRDRPHPESGNATLAWTFGGYSEPRPRFAGEVVVLTPPSSVAALTAGDRPVLHASARSRADR